MGPSVSSAPRVSPASPGFGSLEGFGIHGFVALTVLMDRCSLKGAQGARAIRASAWWRRFLPRFTRIVSTWCRASMADAAICPLPGHDDESVFRRLILERAMR